MLCQSIGVHQMRFFLAFVLLIGVIAAIGCASESGTAPQAAEPTLNPISAQPTAEPTNTHTPVPTDTPAPTATLIPAPTITPAPTATLAPPATPTPTPGPDRRALLEQKGREWGDAFANHDWEAMHATGPDEFKDKCPLDDFAVFFPIVNAYSTPKLKPR